jgi:DNA topoisomerase-3
MGKILVIAEKPSVAQDIAKVLGCNVKGEGCFIGDKYIITWAIGHLITLCEPDEYDPKYKKWSFDTLPIIPEKMKLKPNPKTKKQYDIVKKLMQSDDVDSLICATDSGREGELIFRYIYEHAKCKKPFQRLWISSMTDTAIKEGFANLKPGSEYDNLYFSAKCRSEADWLVGMNASRAFSIKYNALLSIGRVQTPTLAILAQRDKEIKSFVPETYYEVQGNFGDYIGTWFNNETKETKILNKEKAEEIVNKVKGKEGRIKKVQKEEKRLPHPLLYDLTELQRDANKIYGFSAKKTLSIAQDLYEKRKLITYPRTDSRYLSKDMIPKLNQIINKLDKESYGSYINYINSLQKLPITKRIVDDTKVTDHHAIIPTDSKVKIQGLTGDELKIYDLIVRRFLCVFYPEYKYMVTNIVTEVDGESFISKGKTVTQKGWTELNVKSPKQNEEDEQLPQLNIGEKVTANDANVLEKQTKPPKPYNEATLLSAMENAGRFVEDEELKEQLKESGLGTPATRAAIIERLIEVGYVERKGKDLIPTEKGLKLIEIVPDEIKSPEMTGKWEKGLSSISKGTLDPKRFMESITRYVKYLVEKASEVQEGVVFEKENKKVKKKRTISLGKCPACEKGKVLENTKAFYCNEWKNGCKFTIWKNSLEKEGIELNASTVRKLLKEGTADNVTAINSSTKEKRKVSLVLKGKTGIIEIKGSV